MPDEYRTLLIHVKRISNASRTPTTSNKTPRDQALKPTNETKLQTHSSSPNQNPREQHLNFIDTLDQNLRLASNHHRTSESASAPQSSSLLTEQNIYQEGDVGYGRYEREKCGGS
ncbi:hypothetical protein Droror1_Dr00000284 [Drosera rotundifolia]